MLPEELSVTAGSDEFETDFSRDGDDSQKRLSQQSAYRSADRRLRARAVAPRAAAIDETGEFPRDLVREAAGLGLMAVTLDAAWGGGGRDYVSYALALEELARRERGPGGDRDGQQLARRGTVARSSAPTGRSSTWLRRLASGESIGAFALSEEQAGSDAANQQTVARLDDHGYVINGHKVWVANAEAADLVIVFAATQPGLRSRGISAFAVPMDTAGHHARGSG